MAFTYGFYNSLRGDRKYDAMQVSELFDGILADGIIPSQGQLFAVTAVGGNMQINVGTGRAWFFHTWSKNDSVMVLTIPDSDVTRPRIDAVVLEVDRRDEVRANAIKIVTGVPAVNPVNPTLLNTDKIHQYPLAYVTVPAAAEEIKAENIENMVGRSPTVFATGVLETTPLDDLWAQWEGEWDTWFSAIKLQLSGDVVTNLQLQIDGLRTTDGIKASIQVINALGLSGGSTASDALIHLDKQTKDLTNAIINSQNYTKTGEYVNAGTFTHTAKGTSAFVFIIGGGGGGGAGGSGYQDITTEYAYAGGGGGGGAGGNGGELVYKEGIQITKGSNYNIVVGTGGNGGSAVDFNTAYDNCYGKGGGTSSAFGFTAAGGAGGPYGEKGKTNAYAQGGIPTASQIGATGGRGGNGSNNTGDGTNGNDGKSGNVSGSGLTYTVFGGGSGGGGAGATYNNGQTQNGNGGTSSGGGNGSPGARGSANANLAKSASTFGSGGGGGGGGSVWISEGSSRRLVHGTLGGSGGKGYGGRVIIYERGVFG